MPVAPRASRIPGTGRVTTLSRAVEMKEDGNGAAPALRHRGLTHEELLDDLRLACLSRAIDEREITLQKQCRAFFHIAGAGHEALLLGLAHHLRPGYDWFFPYYRDLALMLAFGVTPEQILLQAVGSADDPASGGRQMPSHWGFADKNVVTQSSPTGSQCLPAVGCAEAGRYIARRGPLPGCSAHDDEVTYVSMGEGSTSQGEFWESLNTACTLRLPVLYVVEDNGYAISVPVVEQSAGPISDLVESFPGLAVHRVDGCDYFASRAVAGRAVHDVRSGMGPALIHATVTRPFSHSAADTQSRYRSGAELAEEAERDPVERLERELIEGGLLSIDEALEIRAQAHRRASDAAKEALSAARPDPIRVTDHVHAIPDVTMPADPPPDPAGEMVSFGEAIRRTLHELMGADERVRVFGEDVADAPEALLGAVEGKGGVFGSTRGLQRAFGGDRCYNTPLAEATIVGRAVGQALRHLRPAAEIQFVDYIWPAMQQMKCEAATIRWRSNGAFTCPLVVRAPVGGYLSGGAIWHSQCGESIFAHIPGILVAFPSRSRDAAGLMRAAFLAEDPVLFLEHKHLLRQAYARDLFPPAEWVLPFGRAACVRPGSDLTIVTYGATVEKSNQAARLLHGQGAGSVEVLDLRTIVPWDQEAVAESVRRTGRLLIVHEDVITCGFGAEVAAWAADELFAELDAPVRRVAAKDTHVAYEPTLEAATLPQIEDIVAAARALLAY
ncbi:MAG TPA: thiamine pyrophosphate-dependent enzyme [Acidimicrobiales bacterium]|nr:thiamine pyrophosphate-dependent enzyme [Acidimicrobiales bacterium]